eukprot:2913874-Pleurochrysis_carterae.AAC.1
MLSALYMPYLDPQVRALDRADVSALSRLVLASITSRSLLALCPSPITEFTFLQVLAPHPPPES